VFEKRRNFWIDVGLLLRRYRQKSPELSTLERLGHALGVSKSRVHDIESARSWRRGVDPNTIAEFQEVLGIPSYELSFICKKHEFYPFIFPEQSGARDVYLSSLDVDDEISASTGKLTKLDCLQTLMLYGSFADRVSFQFSAPLKINSLARAIPHILPAFQRNERWELQPVFQVLRSEETPLFSEYLGRRISFLNGESGNPEFASYMRSHALETSLTLDDQLQDAPMKFKRSSIGSDISRRIKAYFSSESRASRGYQLVYPYISDPTIFQTFKLKSILIDNAAHLTERGRQFKDIEMRRMYHSANARANMSLLDTDFIWSPRNIGAIFSLLGLSGMVSRRLSEPDLLGDVSDLLFQIRSETSFRILKDMYFECQNQSAVSEFLETLRASVVKVGVKTNEKSFAVMEEVVMEMHERRVRYSF